MARTFVFARDRSIKWPAACVVCGGSEVVTSGVAARTYTGMGLWSLGYTVKYVTGRVRFPICKRHLIQFRLKKVVYFASFLVMLAFAFYLVPWRFHNALERAVGCLGFGLGASALLFSYLTMPIDVSVQKDQLRVTLQNEMYARDFAELNPYT